VGVKLSSFLTKNKPFMYWMHFRFRKVSNRKHNVLAYCGHVCDSHFFKVFCFLLLNKLPVQFAMCTIREVYGIFKHFWCRSHVLSLVTVRSL
jgi:hypothetical protein